MNLYVASQKTKIKVKEQEANIIGHLFYAASKLWNVCNYERHHYKELGLKEYPNWYYQKKANKDSLWFKQLPSQTAQEVCRLLNGSWKSFYKLKKTGSIANPRPPRFKKGGMPVCYLQNGIFRYQENETIRLSLPKGLKEYMKSTYQIYDNFLYLKNSIFKNIDGEIKQIQLYPPVGDECEVIVVYEIEDCMSKEDNGRYLSIDLGLHNLMACYDGANNRSFIVGRRYLSTCRYFDKRIMKIQSQWYQTQTKKGVQYPKSSKHIHSLYEKKTNSIRDMLHKMTNYIAVYCKDNNIHRVVIGDIKNIRKDKNLGNVNNQKLHGLPFSKIYQLLEYKLAKEGILLIKENEAYSSQCSPLAPKVSKQYAKKTNRKKRGLYKDGNESWNADVVGAYNILRLHFQRTKRDTVMPILSTQYPQIVKVAV